MSESEDSEDDDRSTLVISENTKTTDLMIDDAGVNDVSKDENNKVCNVTKSLNDLVISLTCTLDGCSMDKTNYMLECSNCKRLTHYACTKLPAYQIKLFLLKGYRLYKCSICVGEIHKDIHENCTLVENSADRNQPKKPEEENSNFLATASTQTDLKMAKYSSSSSEELLTHKVRCLEKELEICNNKRLTKFRKTCDKNKKTISVQTTNSIFEAYDKLEREHKTQEKILRDNKQRLNNENADHTRIIDENHTLQQQVNLLREHEENLNSLINDREKTIDEIQTKLNETKPTQENHGNNINNVLTDHLLTKLINEGFNKIEENIDRLITEKLAKKSKEVEQIEANINEALDKNNSYADKLKNNLEVNNFATVIKTTKNNDLIQESERERRSANIIIYGISEVSDNQNTAKEYDETFVHSLLGIIGITSRPKQIIRLGKPIADKARPVKLVMNNSTDKDSIMSRLGNLKNAEEIYRKVSIRDDYTIEEREIIKEWVKKAAEKNKEENTQSWKVRGTPKNGLRLVKITKRL